MSKERTTEQRRISNSEIQAWKDCRRKWYLAYVRRLRLRREDPTGARSIGNRIHAILAWYYDPEQKHKDVEQTVALQLHDELLNEDLTTFPEDADKIRKEGELTRIILEGYFEWLEETGADEGLTVIAPEQKLEAELPLSGKPILQGKIDVRIKREVDDSVMVIDHKTVQEFTTPTKILKIEEQMKTYLLLERLNNPDARTDGAIYNMLRKVKRGASAKPPFYQRVEVRHNVHVMREFYERILTEVSDIIRTEEAINRGETWHAYPRPSRDCGWKCDFAGVCPLMDDPSTNVEGLIEALYESGDPYARYQDQPDTSI
jgi:RecB family exonuclease